jgi:NAD(P) transhydrogenase subunit alpha
MPPLTVGVLQESAPDERRVALVPEVVGRIRDLGVDVLVESGAGDAAWFSDSAYHESGATVATAAEVLARSDILLCVNPPGPDRLDRLRAGQAIVGLLAPLTGPDLVVRCARQGVTAVSLDLLPRTLSRAQTMDALSSQANVAGYRAVLVAAQAYPRYFPLLMTAAGTARPAQVLVLGAGVAGLSAIGTARRLGAQVTGYDIRPATRSEIRSLGAKFLDLPGVESGAGEGGYARALSADEAAAQQRALDEAIGGFDVVITTAQVPGRKPPVLVTEEAVKGMRPGSVVVDMAAGPLGGNVAVSRPDATVVVADGVTVIGAGNLAASMPAGASTAYARNVAALLAVLVRDGAVRVDRDDEILAGVVVTHDGAVVNPTVAAALPASPPDAAVPAATDDTPGGAA